MSVVYRVVERVSNPLKVDSAKKFYPQALTMGKSVDLKFMAQKMKDSSSLSVGDIRSSIQCFVETLKEQLLEGKTVNIEGLGVFLLSIRSKGEAKAEDVTANSASSVRICFQASKELRVSRTATRAGEKLELVSLNDYLKGLGLSATPLESGEGDVEDPTA